MRETIKLEEYLDCVQDLRAFSYLYFNKDQKLETNETLEETAKPEEFPILLQAFKVSKKRRSRRLEDDFIFGNSQISRLRQPFARPSGTAGKLSEHTEVMSK